MKRYLLLLAVIIFLTPAISVQGAERPLSGFSKALDDFYCVYEEGWSQEDAIEFYKQLKRLADYWNEHDIVESHYLSLFADEFFKPKEENDVDTWCGGNGSMLAVDMKGDLYPCIRYHRTSLGDSQPPVIIGNINEGLGVRE